MKSGMVFLISEKTMMGNASPQLLFKRNCFFTPVPAESHSWPCWVLPPCNWLNWVQASNWKIANQLGEQYDLFCGLEGKKEHQPIGEIYFQEIKLIDIKRIRQLKLKLKLREYIKREALWGRLGGMGAQGKVKGWQLLREQQTSREGQTDINWPIELGKLVVLTGVSIPEYLYPHNKFPFHFNVFHKFLFLEIKRTQVQSSFINEEIET